MSQTVSRQEAAEAANSKVSAFIVFNFAFRSSDLKLLKKKFELFLFKLILKKL